MYCTGYMHYKSCTAFVDLNSSLAPHGKFCWTVGFAFKSSHWPVHVYDVFRTSLKTVGCMQLPSANTKLTSHIPDFFPSAPDFCSLPTLRNRLNRRYKISAVKNPVQWRLLQCKYMVKMREEQLIFFSCIFFYFYFFIYGHFTKLFQNR